jgi:hypothetical protein
MGVPISSGSITLGTGRANSLGKVVLPVLSVAELKLKGNEAMSVSVNDFEVSDWLFRSIFR